MRRGVHHARRRLQLEQLLPGAGRAAILRQRFRTSAERRRQHRRGSHARHQAHRALKPQRHHGGGLYFPRVPRIDLLTVGEAFEDLVFVGLPHMPRSGEELRTQQFVSTIGGGALITATAASRLGLRTAVASAMSARAARDLRRDGVRVLNLKRPSEAHAVTVSLSTTRDRSFVTFDGVNPKLESRLPAAIARHPARHIHLAFAPRDCGRWTRIVKRLRAAGITTSWDFGWNPALRVTNGFRALVGAADFIFVNEAEAALYARTQRSAAAVAFWRGAARNTIIKLGPRGSRWIAGGQQAVGRLGARATGSCGRYHWRRRRLQRRLPRRLARGAIAPRVPAPWQLRRMRDRRWLPAALTDYPGAAAVRGIASTVRRLERPYAADRQP